MPRYSVSDLSKLATVLRESHYDGLANTVYWWHRPGQCQPVPIRRWRAGRFYSVMRRPLKEMPLFLGVDLEWVRIIAAERLRMGV